MCEVLEWGTLGKGGESLEWGKTPSPGGSPITRALTQPCGGGYIEGGSRCGGRGGSVTSQGVWHPCDSVCLLQVGEGQHTPAAKGHPPRRRGPHRRWLGCHGLPQPDGVIDSTHILIWAPNHWASLCINEQDLLLHVLQALINHHGQLTHDLLGGQGRRTMPTCSAIAAHFTRWGLGLSSLSVPSGSGTWTCHCALWGDVACAGRLDPSKERCNARLSRACVQVEGAFRCLKAHF